MTEHEMEDLLWDYPDLLLNEPLIQHRRQASSAVSRADLVFVDKIDRLLVIEVKKGVLTRGAIPQVMDHYGSMKTQHPDRSVEMMVVANQIPSERKATLESLHIDWREIPDFRFRALAEQKGYVFTSESAKDEPRVSPLSQPIENVVPEQTVPASGEPTPEHWVRIHWKDDCKDSLRKEQSSQKEFRESWSPTAIHGIVLRRLRDQQVHEVSGLLNECGGSANDIREKLKHIAHRGNCTRKWSVSRSQDWKRVQLTLTS